MEGAQRNTVYFPKKLVKRKYFQRKRGSIRKKFKKWLKEMRMKNNTVSMNVSSKNNCQPDNQTSPCLFFKALK